MKEIKLLCKIGEFQYMSRLLKQGEIYARPLSDFSEMEEDHDIGDKYEISTKHASPPICKITLETKTRSMPLASSTKIEYGESDLDKSGHIYSLAMIDFVWINKTELKIKNPELIDRIGNNYDSIVIIHKPYLFFERIRKHINEMGYGISYGPVNYYSQEDSYPINITPFDKRDKYSYQSEHRIFIDYNSQKPYPFCIGSIEDIAILETMNMYYIESKI